MRDIRTARDDDRDTEQRHPIWKIVEQGGNRGATGHIAYVVAATPSTLAVPAPAALHLLQTCRLDGPSIAKAYVNSRRSPNRVDRTGQPHFERQNGDSRDAFESILQRFLRRSESCQELTPVRGAN